jgi:3-oxoacyl-[acyl-carrier protein] reductase
MGTRFTDRRVIVTGAAQGIGQAIIRAFTREGAKVWGFDIDAEGLANSGAIGATALDLSDRTRVRQAVAEAAEALGTIDILVQAAGGVRGQVGGPVEAVQPAGWHAIFDANVHAAFWCAQAVAPIMQAKGYGRIVNIASGAGLRPSLTGIQAYTAAKHALVGLTKQLSQDLGPFGITTNAVAPGFVRSNPSTEKQWESYGPERQERMVQSIHTRRLGRAEDIANAVLFFADEASGWITGQILSVDGGRS